MAAASEIILIVSKPNGRVYNYTGQCWINLVLKKKRVYVFRLYGFKCYYCFYRPMHYSLGHIIFSFSIGLSYSRAQKYD